MLALSHEGVVTAANSICVELCGPVRSRVYCQTLTRVHDCCDVRTMNWEWMEGTV
jgi:hypothetical protein